MAQPDTSAGHWRVKLVLHYEGRDFHGWQIQRDRRTVQGELSSVLASLCGEVSRKVTAAGRTDQGVHAVGQVASALIPDRFGPAELRGALNALTPPDLWVESAERVSEDFHPRYDAVSRTYIYRVGVDPISASPFHAPHCWPFGRPLIRERLDQATRFIPGDHDFSPFAKSGQPERGVRCRVLTAGWRASPETEAIWEFEITADRYLHRMVRYLVGTLVEVGQGRADIDVIARLLEGAPGFRAAAPAPPQGLFLAKVHYR